MSGQIDPYMQRFVEAETQKQRFNTHVHDLTSACWDKCVGEPGRSLGGKTETCIVNCVERFLDTSNFVVNRLEQEGMQQLQSAQRSKAESEHGIISGEGFKWQ